MIVEGMIQTEQEGNIAKAQQDLIFGNEGAIAKDLGRCLEAISLMRVFMRLRTLDGETTELEQYTKWMLGLEENSAALRRVFEMMHA